MNCQKEYINSVKETLSLKYFYIFPLRELPEKEHKLCQGACLNISIFFPLRELPQKVHKLRQGGIIVQIVL